MAVPDPVAVIVGHVLAGELEAPEDERVLGAAEVDGAPNVTGEHLAGAWPACRILETPAGSDRRLELEVIEPELQVELWDDPLVSARLGDAELRRRLYVILQRLCELPERTWDAGEPVVARVRVSVRGTLLPDPADGQPRALANVLAVMRPAAPLPA